jgi:hypothetical protein
MKKLLMTTILVLGLLLLSATAVPVSAGVEPSPFRDKTVLNRIRGAQNQLGPVISMLDQISEIERSPSHKGFFISVANKVEALKSIAYGTLRTLEDARAMFTGRDEPSYEYAEELTELEGLAELAEDKVLGLSWENVPIEVLISLRDLGILIDEILTVINEFLGEIYGVD